MTLLLQQSHAARDVVIGVAAAAGAGEVLATLLGQARDDRRRIGRSLAEALLLAPRRDGARASDRGTKRILVVAVLVATVAGVRIVNVRGLRAGANTWWTLALGAGVALAGVALRSSAIWTLGRHFRREVTIEPDQRVVTAGPYRWLRHPAYTGVLLTYGGLMLAAGSWVAAVVVGAIVFCGLLPRIRVEERALERAFGPAYADYARTTARLIPHVW